jgi:hypothetical protein
MEILHGGMLVPAFVSVCCAVGTPRRDRATGVVGGAAMFLAMADAGAASPVLPPIAWAMLLVLTALVTSGLASFRQRRSPTVGRSAMTTHRSIGLILGAGLLLLGHTGGSPTSGIVVHTHGAAGSTLLAVVTVGVLLYAVGTVALVRRAGHRREVADSVPLRRWFFDGTLDVVSMAGATILMTASIF